MIAYPTTLPTRPVVPPLRSLAPVTSASVVPVPVPQHSLPYGHVTATVGMPGTFLQPVQQAPDDGAPRIGGAGCVYERLQSPVLSGSSAEFVLDGGTPGAHSPFSPTLEGVTTEFAEQRSLSPAGCKSPGGSIRAARRSSGSASVVFDRRTASVQECLIKRATETAALTAALLHDPNSTLLPVSHGHHGSLSPFLRMESSSTSSASGAGTGPRRPGRSRRKKGSRDTRTPTGSKTTAEDNGSGSVTAEVSLAGAPGPLPVLMYAASKDSALSGLSRASGASGCAVSSYDTSASMLPVHYHAGAPTMSTGTGTEATVSGRTWSSSGRFLPGLHVVAAHGPVLVSPPLHGAEAALDASLPALDLSGRTDQHKADDQKSGSLTLLPAIEQDGQPLLLTIPNSVHIEGEAECQAEVVGSTADPSASFLTILPGPLSPVAPAEEREDVPVLPPSASAHVLRVLVVDDAPDNRRLLGRSLQLRLNKELKAGSLGALAGSGFSSVEVVECEDGDSAVERCLGVPPATARRLGLERSGSLPFSQDTADRVSSEVQEAVQTQPHVFHAITMDAEMPRLNGYAATTLLRYGGYLAPIYGCTGNALPDDQALFTRAGVNQVFCKPVDVAELVRVMCADVQSVRNVR